MWTRPSSWGLVPGRLPAAAHVWRDNVGLVAVTCIWAGRRTGDAVHDLAAGTRTTSVTALRPGRWLVVTELAHDFLHTGVGRGFSLSNRLVRHRRERRRWAQGLRRWQIWLSVGHAQVSFCVH